MSKHPKIYEDETVAVYLELHPYFGCFIHVDSKKWNKKVFRHYMEVFAELLTQLEAKGFDYICAAILEDDKKLMKFSEMFGFEDTGVALKDTQGRERRVFKCFT